MFFCKYYTTNLTFILLMIISILFTNEFLVFPIKIYHPYNFSVINNSDSFSAEDFLKYWAKNELYTYIYIGTPPVKVCTFLESEDYECFMDNSICPLHSVYKNDSSSTFIRNSDFNIYYSTFSHMCFAKETFWAYTDFKLNENKIKKLDNLTFLYARNPNRDELLSKLNNYNINITGFSCLHMGFQLSSSNFFDIMVNQLKDKDYIESTYWTIEFNSNNLFESNDLDYLVIGLPPHKYNPNKYDENFFKTTVAQLRTKDYDLRVNSWGLNFDKIYFSNNVSSGYIQYKVIKCKFLFSLNIIEGSREYLDNIENEFFNQLYEEKICNKNEIIDNNENYFVIWCNKNNFSQIKKFPTLYFKSIELNYTFELTYEDLFVPNKNKIFFMVIFKKRGYMFTLGKIFLKKYLMTFSFDNKLIGFYDNNNKISKHNNKLKNNENNLKKNIIISIFMLFCFILLFIIFIMIKKRCLTERQKRMNELVDDNYIYMINKASQNNSTIN